jgi:hypothetical protein
VQISTREDIGDWVPLVDAVAEYRAVCGYASSVETYRKHAAQSGSVHLGASVTATKDRRGRWVVSRIDLDSGLAAERERMNRIARRTADYGNHILDRSTTERMPTEWGYYEVRRNFHFRYDTIDAYRKRSNGTSICNTCWTSTQTEHDHPECHASSDWGDCGRDCTLSAIRC